MRFAFVEKHRNSIPAERLYRILDVTPRGYRAWRKRPACQRQREYLVLLAHIREQHRLSLQSYGRPRMTEELKELGLNVGHRRVGRSLLGDVNITCQATDAPERHIGCQNPQIQGHDGQQPQVQHCAKPVEPELFGGSAQSEMGG